MIHNKLKKLAKLKAAVARFEGEIADEVRYELANLPMRYGFESHTDFLKAVKDACRGGAERPRKGPGKRAL